MRTKRRMRGFVIDHQDASLHLLFLLQRQREEHGCALARLAAQPDAAAVRLDDRLAQEQTQPGPLRAAAQARIDAVEALEQLALLLCGMPMP